MELNLSNLSYSYKNKVLINNLCININSDDGIVGLIGNFKSLLMEIIDLRVKIKGDIILDNSKISNSNINSFRKRIALITQDNIFFTTTVSDEFRFIIRYNNYKNVNIKKKIEDSLTIVGLNKSYLNRKINTLSDSELFLFKLACNLIYNPDVIMIDDGIDLLDHNSKKIVMNLLKKLNGKKNKIVIIASNNINFVYSNCKNTILFNDGNIVKYEKTAKLLVDVNLLNNNGIDIPNLVRFVNCAKEKNIKISYHTDILDLIKDVYRHV